MIAGVTGRFVANHQRLSLPSRRRTTATITASTVITMVGDSQRRLCACKARTTSRGTQFCLQSRQPYKFP